VRARQQTAVVVGHSVRTAHGVGLMMMMMMMMQALKQQQQQPLMLLRRRRRTLSLQHILTLPVTAVAGRTALASALFDGWM